MLPFIIQLILVAYLVLTLFLLWRFGIGRILEVFQEPAKTSFQFKVENNKSENQGDLLQSDSGTQAATVYNEPPLTTVRLTINELNKLILSVGAKLQSLLEKKLPYTFDLTKENILYQYLKVSLEVYTVKINTFSVDWKDFRLEVKADNTLCLKANLNELHIESTIAVQAPLCSKINETISAIIVRPVLSLDIKVITDATYGWGMYTEIQSVDFQFSKLQVNLKKSKQFDWLFEATIKTIEKYLPYALKLIPKQVNTLLKREVFAKPSVIQFKIGEQIQELILAFPGGIQCYSDLQEIAFPCAIKEVKFVDPFNTLFHANHSVLTEDSTKKHN